MRQPQIVRTTLDSLLSSKAARTWVRRITRIWLWITVLSFLVYAWLNDEPHPLLRGLLMFVAMAEVLAITLESACRRIDEAEIKVLQGELGKLSAHHAPRSLSESQRDILKATLSKYAGQPSLIEVNDFGGEVGDFAGELLSTLRECGWIGNIKGTPASVRDGIVLTNAYEDINDRLDTAVAGGWPAPADLHAALRSVGLEVADNPKHWHSKTPWPWSVKAEIGGKKKTITIAVGPKPYKRFS